MSFINISKKAGKQMYQEEFLPIVFNVGFSSNQAWPVEKWRSRIHDVLHLYVDQICENDDRMIGHIKALAQINALGCGNLPVTHTCEPLFDRFTEVQLCGCRHALTVRRRVC